VNPVLSQSSRDFSDAMQQMIIEAERAMYHIQDSVPVSIRDYHSLAGKGQGLVDELAIMQRAVNTIGNNGGGYLFLPKGDYFFNNVTLGGIVHSFDNVVIIGEGENTVIHQQLASQVTIGIGSPVPLRTTTGAGVKDLLIDDPIGGIGSVAIALQQGVRSFIDRVAVTGIPHTGIWVLGGTENHVTNNNCTVATAVGDFFLSPGGGIQPSNLLVMQNIFDIYANNATTATNVVIRDNAPVTIPTYTVNGVNQTIGITPIITAPHKALKIIGAAALPNPDSVDTIAATWPGDERTFIFSTLVLVDFNDNLGNLHLAGLFQANAGGQEDTLTLICDGTNWIEVSRSNN
jgi:hypothetical protein